jgi:phosphate uptake regulator
VFERVFGRETLLEIRKLQKIKGGSFTLSVPKQWVEKRKLASGEQIAVHEEEDGSLRIFPVAAPFEKPFEVTLSLEDYPNLRALEYCVDTYYIQGSNRINIVSKKIISAEQKRRLKQFRTELPGVEVAEEEADRLSFQVLIDPTTFSLESLIEKTSTFSLKLQEDAVKSLVDSNLPLAKEVLERSREAQRHYRVTIRQVASASLSRTIAEKVGVKNCQECITFALIARDLSRLVYHSSLIASHVLSLEGRRINNEVFSLVLEMSLIAYKMQDDAVEAFLRKDVKLAISVMAKMSQIREEEKILLKRIMEKTKDVDAAVALGMVARDLRRIAGYAVAVADDAMNRVLTPTAR